MFGGSRQTADYFCISKRGLGDSRIICTTIRLSCCLLAVCVCGMFSFSWHASLFYPFPFPLPLFFILASFCQVLRPGLVKGQWDEKEDAALMKLATKPFKNWGTLSNSMPGELRRSLPPLRPGDG